MLHPMGLRGTCWLLACLLVAQENATHPSELRDSAETYAVYSAILADPPLSHRNVNTKYAVADTILLSKDRIGAPASAWAQTPRVSRESLAQIASDFEQHKNSPMPLKRAFSLSKPYVLLSRQQINEFEWWRSGHIQTDPPSLDVDPYSGAIDLIRLSGVFFDQSNRVAMVYVSASCGTLCGLWGWHILEKASSGRWQEIRTARCSATIS